MLPSLQVPFISIIPPCLLGKTKRVSPIKSPILWACESMVRASVTTLRLESLYVAVCGLGHSGRFSATDKTSWAHRFDANTKIRSIVSFHPPLVETHLSFCDQNNSWRRKSRSMPKSRLHWSWAVSVGASEAYITEPLNLKVNLCREYGQSFPVFLKSVIEDEGQLT